MNENQPFSSTPPSTINVMGEGLTESSSQYKLLKGEALQSAIFNSANFSSIVTDERGIIQLFNVGAERMLGYTASDVVNKITPADITDPQELIARAQVLSTELATPIALGFEVLVFKASRGIEDIYDLTYIRKDGSRFPVVVSVTTLRDEQNIIIGYLLIGTDNTAHKQAEEALLKAGVRLEHLRVEEALCASEERYRTLFESIDEGFCIIEKMGEASEPLDFRFLEANPAFTVHSGFSDVVGKTLRQVIPDECDEWLITYNAILKTGESIRFERRLISQGRVLELYAFRVADATQQRVGVSFKDITERKRTEELLRRNHETFFNMIENAPFGVYVVDAQFQIWQASKTSLSAFNNISPLIGRDFGDVMRILWHEDFASEAIQRFRHTLETGAPYIALNMTEQRRNIPEIQSYDWKIERIILPDGQFGVVCYFYDITERKQAEDALRASEERYHNLFNSMDEGFCIIEMIFDEHENPIDYCFLEVNPSFEKQSGMRNVIGKRMREMAPDHEAYWFEIYSKVALTGEALRFVNQAKALGHSWFDLYAFRVGGPGSRRVAVIFTNITERKLAEKALHESLRELRTAEAELRVTERALSHEKSALADHVFQLQQTNARLLIATIEAHKLAEEIEQARIQMTHLAQHDALTDLPNRLLFNDRLAQAIALAHRQGTQLAVMFLDLDHFKHINDSLGHGVGDQLLQSVAKRLTAGVRSSDTVCRQGGDEFVMLFAPVEHAEDAILSAEKILAALLLPHYIDGLEIHVTVSIGISIYPEDGLDVDTLIKNADTAMYQAKAGGRNNYQFFEQNMNVLAVERHAIEGGLRHALVRQELVLHYQPKINLLSGAIVGVEALIRWQHPERGLLLPAQFVSIAEDCGLILPIGRWVLREACRQARAWRQAGLPPITIAVNTSALEFRARDFIENIQATLEDSGLEPHYLEIELTESVLMRDAESASFVLWALADLGVKLAVDDFGTGYSSLSYLRQFPIDILKIDQSFVNQITSTSDNAAIVSTVISLGQSLQQCVIAEGVETSEQYAFLLGRQCDEGQGYYFCRPLTADALSSLLRTGLTPFH